VIITENKIGRETEMGMENRRGIYQQDQLFLIRARPLNPFVVRQLKQIDQ